MKVAMLMDRKKIEIQEVPVPELLENQVLVKVSYASICGSDVHAYNDLMFAPGTVLGHEFSGMIERVGPKAKGHQVGDRVVLRPPGLCGCTYCEKGEFALCDEHFDNTLGLKIQGGFADYVAAYDFQAIPLPETISLKDAAQMEPLAVCVRAVNSAGVKLGDKVLIYGCGPIGLVMLQLVKLYGASEVYTIDTSPSRLEKSRELGADMALNPLHDDVVAILKPLGLDMIYDCVGREVTINTSMEIIRKGAKIVMVGATTEKTALDQLKWVQKGLTIQASMGYFVEDFHRAVALAAAGKVDFETLVSHVMPLAQINEAMELLTNPETALKILLTP